MARLEHAAIAIVLLVGFVADLRFVVPCVLGVVLWWMIRHRADRVESAIGVVLLAASTVAFGAGNEVLAWACTLAVAVGAGVIATRPTAKERPVGAR
ncbi:MAG: hypothetical protein QOD30_1270 [Actinomycetota bacterium]|jgi:hypothetical protein|nr:hypothetical protein [Actinomycetota bacterium]